MTRTGVRALVAVLVFLLTAEGALRVALWADGDARLHRLGWRTQRASVVLRGLLGAGGGFHALPRMAHDPDLGWTPRPGVEEEAGVVYTVDGAHRRVTGPPGLPAGRPRVVLLGDSFTFGDEVSDPETWAWRLRAATGAEVLNLGALGYGLDQVLLRWERDGAPLAPDVVVVGHLDLLHHRTGRAFSSWAKPWFTVEAGGDLALHGVPVPGPETLLRRQVVRPMLPGVLLDAAEGALEPSDADPMTPVLPVSARLLERLLGEIAETGARPVLAHFLHASALEGPADQRRSADRVFEESCRHFDIVCVDLRPALTAARDEGVALYRVAHWSPEGNAVVARELARALRAEGLLGPPGDPPDGTP